MGRSKEGYVNTHEQARKTAKNKELVIKAGKEEEDKKAAELRKTREAKEAVRKEEFNKAKEKIESQAGLPMLGAQMRKVQEFHNKLVELSAQLSAGVENPGFVQKISNKLSGRETISQEGLRIQYDLIKKTFEKEKAVLDDLLQKAQEAVGIASGQIVEEHPDKVKEQAKKEVLPEVQKIELKMAGLGKTPDMLISDGFVEADAIVPSNENSGSLLDSEIYDPRVEEFEDLYNTGHEMILDSETGKIFTKDGEDTSDLDVANDAMRVFEHKYSNVANTYKRAHEKARAESPDEYDKDPNIAKNYLSEDDQLVIEEANVDFADDDKKLTEAKDGLKIKIEELKTQEDGEERVKKFEYLYNRIDQTKQQVADYLSSFAV